jgi:hypothetical protein
MDWLCIGLPFVGGLQKCAGNSRRIQEEQQGASFSTQLTCIKLYFIIQPSSQIDIENCELVQYEIMILTEAGRLDDALSRLEENSASIMDRLAYFETRASLLMQMGRLDDAERVYWSLVDRNPDNIFYYKQIEKCRKFGED